MVVPGPLRKKINISAWEGIKLLKFEIALAALGFAQIVAVVGWSKYKWSKHEDNMNLTKNPLGNHEEDERNLN